MSRKSLPKKRSPAVLLETLKRENSADKEPEQLPKQFKDSSTQTDQPNVDVKLDKALLLMAHANAKLDALGSSGAAKCKDECGAGMLRKIILDPVKTFQELEALEEGCKKEEYVKQVVASIGALHGRQRYTSRGGTVCLQIIDYFFDRQFLVHCSWTGTGRKANDDEQVPRKIPFSRYAKVINLFYQTVLHSDPEFSLDECRTFLHRCLRNAKQRLEELGGIRRPVARKRKQHRDDLDEEHLNDSDQENGQKQEEGEGSEDRQRQQQQEWDDVKADQDENENVQFLYDSGQGDGVTETRWTMEVAAADVI